MTGKVQESNSGFKGTEFESPRRYLNKTYRKMVMEERTQLLCPPTRSTIRQLAMNQTALGESRAI